MRWVRKAASGPGWEAGNEGEEGKGAEGPLQKLWFPSQVAGARGKAQPERTASGFERSVRLLYEEQVGGSWRKTKLGRFR